MTDQNSKQIHKQGIKWTDERENEQNETTKRFWENEDIVLISRSIPLLIRKNR